MNKLGKRKYIQLIANALNESYGNTLWEGNTDITMARAVLKKLTPYLYFHSHDISTEEFNRWKKVRTDAAAEYYAEDNE